MTEFVSWSLTKRGPGAAFRNSGSVLPQSPCFHFPEQLQLHKPLFLPAVWLSLLVLYVHFWDSKANDKEFCFWNYISRSWTLFWSYQKNPLYTASFQKSFLMMQSNPKYIKNARFREVSLGHSRPAILLHHNQPQLSKNTIQDIG